MLIAIVDIVAGLHVAESLSILSNNIAFICSDSILSLKIENSDYHRI